MALYRLSAPVLFTMGIVDILGGLFAIALPFSVLAYVNVALSASAIVYLGAALVTKGVYSLIYGTVKS